MVTCNCDDGGVCAREEESVCAGEEEGVCVETLGGDDVCNSDGAVEIVSHTRFPSSCCTHMLLQALCGIMTSVAMKRRQIITAGLAPWISCGIDAPLVESQPCA